MAVIEFTHFSKWLPLTLPAYIAANQAVSASSADISSDRDLSMASVWEFLSSRMWPSLFMARQLRAKHAFLLVPASQHDSMTPMDDIYNVT